MALCSVSLSVMELNALSQNSQVGTQIRPQEVDLNLAASGNPVEMAALAGVGLTRSALALAEKIWGFAGDLSPKVKVAILCILMVALFAACSSPAIAIETVASSTPTTVSAPATLEPTATREPTKAPTKTPTTAPTLTPTEAPIPAFMDPYVNNPRRMDQFETPPNERFWTSCLLKRDSLRTTNFTFGDLKILKVIDCYFLSKDKKLQVVSLPMAFYNPLLDVHWWWGSPIQKGQPPSQVYLDNMIGAVTDARTTNGAGYGQFNFKESGYTEAAWVAAFRPTAQKFPTPSNKFFTNGDTSEFKDFPGAKKFVFPSDMNFTP